MDESKIDELHAAVCGDSAPVVARGAGPFNPATIKKLLEILMTVLPAVLPLLGDEGEAKPTR